MYVLGLWDGHDSGAALVEDDRILFAANEERYTRRKLEVKFPYNSIREALGFAGLKPTDIEVVSFPTTEPTKTLSRVFPWQKERYYMFRRRKMPKPRFENLMHYTKYAMTSIGPLPGCGVASKMAIGSELRRMGFSNFKLHAVDHHTAHAATAAFTSGMSRSLVVTLDGLGDGISGSVSTFKKGELLRESVISARNSLGIFFEQVTNIVGMRELEDEGKVMAMADYSFPFGFEQNKLRDFFSVDDTEILAKYGPITQYKMLQSIAWQMPREQFAYMAQQLLEKIMAEFFGNVIDEYGISSVAMSGGIMSNVKANMVVRELPQLKGWYIFPHMGDGGIALGAAMYTNYQLNSISSYEFNDSYLGNSYESDYVKSVLRKEKGIRYDEDSDPGGHAAELLEKGEYVFWFQGRMEYGPRALGNRSIVARADSDSVKNRLNLYVKQREWYQPFAPAMLEEEADRLLYAKKGYSPFMTMAYRIREKYADRMKSVIHVDMTARPQTVGSVNKRYRKLIEGVKRSTGYGVVLNTSFNIHGQPIVTGPEDALVTMKKTKTREMFLGDYLVINKGAR
jgi:carbamoyltransferase